MRVGLWISFGVDLGYTLWEACLGWLERSVWFGSLASYYLVLSLCRLLMLRSLGCEGSQARQRSCLCGWLLLVLTPAIAAISFYTVYGRAVVYYPGYSIYGAAAYVFYKLTMAAWSLIRRREGPVHDAVRVLSLTAALVSLFFLQTAMLAMFGEGESWHGLMSLLTGGGVFLLVLAMAVTLIRKRPRAE